MYEHNSNNRWRVSAENVCKISLIEFQVSLTRYSYFINQRTEIVIKQKTTYKQITTIHLNLESFV